MATIAEGISVFHARSEGEKWSDSDEHETEDNSESSWIDPMGDPPADDHTDELWNANQNDQRPRNSTD